MQSFARRAAAPVFTLAMFSSAALIFVLQPLFARLVTPLLGGSPAVWNTSMAFFQGALLVGYLYAHLLARLKDLRLQSAIHVGVLILAGLTLPIHVSGVFGAPSSEHPALWLVGVLTLSVGAPFAVASATAPLLQSWYARSGRADADDPYYLYAASNAGSFIGLLAYPILIEPLFDTHAQGAGWAMAYSAVAVMIAVAGIAAIAAHGPPKTEHPPLSAAPRWRQRLYWIAAAAVPSALTLGVTQHISTDVASAPMLWVVPLALYLATFVIAFSRAGRKYEGLAALLHPVALAMLVGAYFWHGNWAAGIGGNLIGFTLSALVCHYALARTRPEADRLTEFYFWVSLGGVAGGAFAAFFAPVAFNNVYEYPLALAAAALFLPRGVLGLPRLGDVSGVMALAMTAAGAVLLFVDARYAVLALGALGAAAAVLAAGWRADLQVISLQRLAFLIVAAAFAAVMLTAGFNFQHIFPQSGSAQGAHAMAGLWRGLIAVFSAATIVFAAHASLQPRDEDSSVENAGLGVGLMGALLAMSLALVGGGFQPRHVIVIGLGACVIAIFLNRARPPALAVLILAAFALIFVDDRRGGEVITQERSFFGVLRTEQIRVGEAEAPDQGPIYLRILKHGTTIHGAQLTGPNVSRLPLTYYHPNTGLGEAVLAGLALRDENRLALIGLGAGATSCLMGPRDHLTIYEIDPAVVALSTTALGDFSYVRQCQPDFRVELGDARLRIADAPDGAYDVIVVDAFSSDAIPAHLLTREAVALYLSKLSERGIVILHLSNRNLALVSEAARVAASLNAPYVWRINQRVTDSLAGRLTGLPASTMIVARSPETLAALPLASLDWRALDAPPGRPWSDDYINLPRALWDQFTGQEECLAHPYVERCGPEGEETNPPPDAPG